MLTPTEYNEIFDILHNDEKLEEDSDGNKYIEIHEILNIIHNYVRDDVRQGI